MEFIILFGILTKYGKFSEQIKSKYLVYINELNDYFTKTIDEKEKEKSFKNEYYLFNCKAYFYYFGLNGSDNQNLQKASEYFDKGFKICDLIFEKKRIAYFKNNIKKSMNELKLLSNDELIKSKKDLIEFFYKDLYIKQEIFDCYIVGKDYFEGITKKKR